MTMSIKDGNEKYWGRSHPHLVRFFWHNIQGVFFNWCPPKSSKCQMTNLIQSKKHLEKLPNNPAFFLTGSFIVLKSIKRTATLSSSCSSRHGHIASSALNLLEIGNSRWHTPLSTSASFFWNPSLRWMARSPANTPGICRPPFPYVLI